LAKSSANLKKNVGSVLNAQALSDLIVDLALALVKLKSTRERLSDGADRPTLLSSRITHDTFTPSIVCYVLV
jgi:hypothetical protein